MVSLFYDEYYNQQITGSLVPTEQTVVPTRMIEIQSPEMRCDLIIRQARALELILTESSDSYFAKHEYQTAIVNVNAPVKIS